MPNVSKEICTFVAEIIKKLKIMKKILGLDLGTNSIGWAIVERDDNKGRIIKSGSRIIPMDAATLGDLASGNTKSQTAERTSKRTARRMKERFLLRRERLHRLLRILGFLPKHYEERIGWDLYKGLLLHNRPYLQTSDTPSIQTRHSRLRKDTSCIQREPRTVNVYHYSL